MRRVVTWALTADVRHVFAVVWLVAFLIRLPYVLMVPVRLHADMGWYDDLAKNVAAGLGYFRTDPGTGVTIRGYPLPGYPLFLVFFYVIFGANYRVIAQGILGAATVALAFLLGDKLSRVVGLASAGLLLGFFFYDGVLLTETLHTFLFALCVYLLVGHIVGLFNGSPSQILPDIFLGLVMGLAFLTKPITAVLFPVLAMTYWLTGVRNVRQSLLAFVLVLIGALAVVSPWLARNYVVFGRLTIGSGSVGFAAANSDAQLKGEEIATEGGRLYRQAQALGLSESERELWFYQQGLNWIMENKPRALLTMVKRTLDFWGLQDLWGWWPFPLDWQRGFLPQAVQMFLLLVYKPVYFLALIGMVFSAKRLRVLCVPLLTVIAFTLFHTFGLFWAAPRYHVPLIPLLAVFAAYGCVVILSFYSPRLAQAHHLWMPVGDKGSNVA